MNEIQPETLWARLCGADTAADRRNGLRLLLVTAIWAVCAAGVKELLKQGALADSPLRWLVAVLPTVCGVLVFLTYLRLLREMDELQRLLQIQALAFAFGGGVLAFMGYRMFELLGAPRIDRGEVLSLMMALYIAGYFVSWFRYR